MLEKASFAKHQFRINVIYKHASYIKIFALYFDLILKISGGDMFLLVMEKPTHIRPVVSVNPGKDRPCEMVYLNQFLRMEKKSCDLVSSFVIASQK